MAAVPDWYPELLDAVTDHVQTGRRRAVSAASQELISTYWAVGAEILARQEAEGWGARVIDRLAGNLRERFPDASGFSPRNLKYMRAFAAAWPDKAIVQAPLAQLPWYHHVALIEKLDSAERRLWYAKAAIEQGWSRNVLVHHIEGRFHERAGRAITNFTRTIPRLTLIWPSNRPAIPICSTSSVPATSDVNVTSNAPSSTTSNDSCSNLDTGSRSSESRSTSKSETPTSTPICCSIT